MTTGWLLQRSLIEFKFKSFTVRQMQTLIVLFYHRSTSAVILVADNTTKLVYFQAFVN